VRNKRRLLTAAAAALLIAATAPTVFASDPPSNTVAVPSVLDGEASATWSGSVPAQSVNPTSECAEGSGTDSHGLTFTVPAGLYDTKAATFVFSITWTPNNPGADVQPNDLIITILGPDGAVVGGDDTAETTEKVTLSNLKAGDYKVLACGYVNLTDQPYTGKVSVKTTALGTANGNPFSTNDNQLKFTDATVVDPILFGGEPGINFDPTTDGSRLFVDWPVGSRANIGVLFRSDDGGLTFRKRYADVTDPDNSGLTCAGRQVPMCTSGGGGDTDVNVNPGNGNVYFTSQEALAAQSVAASLDHGVSFPTDHTDPVLSLPCTGVDRQWLASWSNTDDVFISYHVPLLGQCFNHSPSAGTTGSWTHSLAATNVTQSGAMVADNTGGPTDHNLYIVYNTSFVSPDTLDAALKYGVAASTDGGATFVAHVIPDAHNIRNFNKIQIDTAGNLYATWVDSQSQHTWFSTSLASDPANVTAPASKWSKAVQVEGLPIHVSIFPDVVAGSPGKAAVAYYGTPAAGPTPDDVEPGQGGWFPYVSTTDNALCQWDANPCTSPTFHQSVIAHQSNQDDDICTMGTACTGNRNLLDYFDISLDKDGYVGFVWSDTRNQTLLPFVKVARQATGPSLYNGKPDAQVAKRTNGNADAAGDALYPIAGKKLLDAANQPGQDLLGTSVTFKDPSTMEFRIKVADTSKLGAFPTGNDDLTLLQQAKYLVRWDFGGKAFYAGANVASGSTAPTFFAGEVSTAESVTAAGSNGNLANTYKALVTDGVTGSVADGAIVIDVPVAAVGNPGLNAPLLSVGSFAMVGPTDTAFLLVNNAPIVVDATPTFDTALSGPAARALLGGRGPGGPSVPLPATGGPLRSWLLGGLGLLLASVLLRLGRRRAASR
jgi:hypothetical protein